VTALALAYAIDAISGSSDDSDTHRQTDAQEHVLELGVSQEDIVVDKQIGRACDDSNPEDEHEEGSHGGEALDKSSHYTL